MLAALNPQPIGWGHLSAKGISTVSKSKNHHWWPVALQSYWTDKAGDVSWIDSEGKTHKKRAANRKIGFKIHGHTTLQGSGWEYNFESTFAIDNKIHEIVGKLKALRPFGLSPSDLAAAIRLCLQRDANLHHWCKFYNIDEATHRNLLLLIYSLLVRSPANRSRCESFSRLCGLPDDEDVGKENMAQMFSAAQKVCRDGLISNHYFVLLHSPRKRFVCGDGYLDWLTDALTSYSARGKALVPITPAICLYFCTLRTTQPSPNCASLFAAPWMVDAVNEIIQIYSRDKLFFMGRPPELNDAFKQGKFFVHKQRANDLIEILDKIASRRNFTQPCSN